MHRIVAMQVCDHGFPLLERGRAAVEFFEGGMYRSAAAGDERAGEVSAATRI
jgi:hypothetical protein